MSLWDSGPSAGFIPFVWGLALGMLSIILLIKETLRRNVEKEKAGERIHINKKILLYGLLPIFYYFTFNPLGFLISTVLFLIPIIHFAENQPWRKAIWVSVAISIVYYVIFYILLKIPLPRGLFNF
jgi:putative tricarboxylic transport membrane protein